MTKYVVEFQMAKDCFVYRKLSLVEADDPKAAAKIISDQLATEKRFDFRLYSVEPLKRTK